LLLAKCRPFDQLAEFFLDLVGLASIAAEADLAR
jgi:hypothetical protein